MYGNGGAVAGGTGAAGGLAYTGFHSLWLLFAVLALITAGVVIKNLLPKQEY